MQKLEVKNAESVKAVIQEYFVKNEEARFIHRLHGILLLLDKPENTCQTVSSLFGKCHTTLANWVNKLNQTSDIESLRSVKNSGRPPKLSIEQKEELKKILQEFPEKVGITANVWDGKSLSHYIKIKYAIDLKTRSCQDLFKELGFSLKRARPMVAKGDDQKKAVFKKNLKP
jgi:transposase